MSSDEEILDPMYVRYQRHVDGLPVESLSNKGKEKAYYTGDDMEWETTNNSGPKENTSAVQQEDGDEEESFVYSDPDDREPTPVPRGRNEREDVRLFPPQNQKSSNTWYRAPLRTLNSKEIKDRLRSPARRRGRHFGARSQIPPRTAQQNRNIFPQPPQPLLQRTSRPYSQHHIRPETDPRRSPAFSQQDIPDVYNDEPPQHPLPARPLPFTYHRPRPRQILGPRDIKLTDDAHFVPEREHLRWSNRKYEKGAGRSGRKKKALAFVDSFEGTFSPVSRLRFAVQARPGNLTAPSDDEEQFEDDPILEDGGIADFEPGLGLQMSPIPGPPAKPLMQARKTIEISDDSDPESAEDLDGSVSDRGPSSDSDIEEIQKNIVTPPPKTILDAIQIVVSPRTSGKLPFLRRNLKRSFYHSFVDHLAAKPRPLPKVRFYASGKPSVCWKYQTDLSGWEVAQSGWACQLCCYFPPFTLGAALLYHLQRDHPIVSARRKKLGFQRWRIVIDLLGPTLPATILIATRELSPLREPIVPLLDATSTSDGEEVFDEDPQPIQVEMDIETGMEAERYRVGGTKCYDLAMQEMPLSLRGLAAKAFEGRENDMCFFTRCSDKEKAMAVIWGRWICHYRLEFLKQPLQNTILFIDTHWDIIRRTAEQEGLIRWLLAMKFHHYFTQSQVATLSKRYQRHLP